METCFLFNLKEQVHSASRDIFIRALLKGCGQAASPVAFICLDCFVSISASELIWLGHLRVPLNLPHQLCYSASISLICGTSPPSLRPHRAANARQASPASLTGELLIVNVLKRRVHLCVCLHVLVCVCGPFSTPLGPLICFGSVC